MNNIFGILFINRRWRLALWAFMAAAGLANSGAALYRAGDIATNFSFIARQPFTRPDGTLVPAGGQVHLQDFAGRVVFLEWFAVWCPYCVAAAPQVRTGIADWYASRGGNPHGVPVLHIAVNQESQAGYKAATDAFVTQQGFSPVVNDYGVPGGKIVRFAFQNSGQPVFAIINGVTNSASHKPWEVLVNYLGYGQTDFNKTLAGFRTVIDTVRPGVAAPRPEASGPHQVGEVFEFNFQGRPGLSYRVMSSTNLVDWTTEQTLDGSTDTTIFRHTNAPPSKNFYRVVTP